MVKMVLGGIIGAIIAFGWMFVSWTVLPWHQWSMHSFKNQEFVSWVMKENAPKSGVYMAPMYKSTEGDLSPDEIERLFEEQKASLRKGPLVYAQVKTEGMDPQSPKVYIYTFLTLFLGAFLISGLLKQAIDLTYKGRLFFVMRVGLVVGVLGYFPDWTWFGAGWKFTLVMVADLVITWFLAGLFLAAFIKDKEVPERELMM